MVTHERHATDCVGLEQIAHIDRVTYPAKKAALRWGKVVEDAEIERLSGRAPRLGLEDIVRHPRFAEARKVYLDRFLDVYGDDPFLVRLLIEIGRFAVYMLAVILEAAQDPARRETWFTIGRLKQHMTTFGLASERQVDRLIARLCQVGFMELRPSEQDRRVRILSPTEKLRAHDRDWLAAHYVALTVLYPQHDYGLVMRRDPEFQAVHQRTCAAFLPLGMKIMQSVPETMLFFDYAAGHIIVAALLQAAMARPDHPHPAVPYADIGDRFGVSRTHVRKLLVAAEDAGLVKLHARGGRRVEILPRLWSSYDRGISGGMYLHDILYLAATGALNDNRVAVGASATARQAEASRSAQSP